MGKEPADQAWRDILIIGKETKMSLDSIGSAIAIAERRFMMSLPGGLDRGRVWPVIREGIDHGSVYQEGLQAAQFTGGDIEQAIVS